jgi:hypothetical protein
VEMGMHKIDEKMAKINPTASKKPQLLKNGYLKY